MADCTQAHSLTADLPAQYLLADRGYDTNSIVAEAVAQGMEPEIPPRSQRKEPRNYDRALCNSGELISGLQAMACRSDSVCQERSVLPGHLPNQGIGNLDCIILTTPLNQGLSY